MTDADPLAAWWTVLEALLETEGRAAPSPAQLRAMASRLEEMARRFEGVTESTEPVEAGEPFERLEASEAAEPELVTRELSIGGRVVELRVAVDGEEEADPRPPTPETVPAAVASGPPSSPRASRAELDEAWGAGLRRSRLELELMLRACEAVLEVDAPASALPEEAQRLGRPCPWPLVLSSGSWDVGQLDLCRRTYANLLHAVETVLLDEAWTELEEAPERDDLLLVAEAQSALRVALCEASQEEDPAQLRVFRWLRAQAERHRVFLPQFMRLDSPADPAKWGDLMERLVAWRGRVEERVSRQRAARGEKHLLNKLSYEVQKLAGALDEEERVRRWTALLGALESWVEAGRPPSAVALQERLEALAGGWPEDLGPGARAVRDAQERRRCQLAEQRAARGESNARPPSATVREARRLLAGKRALLIGGERRAQDEERLRRDLGLSSLIWIGTRAHRPLAHLVEAATRPEVDLVLILIRFSDHALGELREPTEAAGKVFVRLKAGYGSERVAHDVLEQASERLGR